MAPVRSVREFVETTSSEGNATDVKNKVLFPFPERRILKVN